METALPQRKHLRMQGWDFTSPGWYFITICTAKMRFVFGVIVNGRMVLNAAGRVADQFWREIPAHFPRAVVDEYVVMPNHVHGLLQLVDSPTACHSATACRGGMEAFGKPVAGSVPTIMRSYKSAVTRALGEQVWQGRFYEVRARDDAARMNIRHYIRANPQNFHVVVHGAEPKYRGNQALLDQPKVGFLASRGPADLPGKLSMKPGEVILSGFLSPMERTVFRAGLQYQRPMIWVKPYGLEEALDAPCRVAVETALREGRLLMVSPFEEAIEAPSVRRAAWCNQYVVAHCARVVVGYLNPAGMLACVLSEADPDKELVYL
jgi:REP element-mobilizing transposase RayT